MIVRLTPKNHILFCGIFSGFLIDFFFFVFLFVSHQIQSVQKLMFEIHYIVWLKWLM